MLENFNLEPNGVRGLVTALDSDGDGWIQYHEFCALLDGTLMDGPYPLASPRNRKRGDNAQEDKSDKPQEAPASSAAQPSVGKKEGLSEGQVRDIILRLRDLDKLRRAIDAEQVCPRSPCV